MLQSLPVSSGVLSSGSNQLSFQQCTVAHPSVPQQSQFGLLNKPSSTISPTQPSPTHQIYSRMSKQEPNIPATNIAQRGAIMNRMWKPAHEPLGGYVPPTTYGNVPPTSGSYMERPSTSYPSCAALAASPQSSSQLQQQSGILENLISPSHYGPQPPPTTHTLVNNIVMNNSMIMDPQQSISNVPNSQQNEQVSSKIIHVTNFITIASIMCFFRIFIHYCQLLENF